MEREKRRRKNNRGKGGGQGEKKKLTATKMLVRIAATILVERLQVAGLQASPPSELNL